MNNLENHLLEKVRERTSSTKGEVFLYAQSLLDVMDYEYVPLCVRDMIKYHCPHWPIEKEELLKINGFKCIPEKEECVGDIIIDVISRERCEFRTHIDSISHVGLFIPFTWHFYRHFDFAESAHLGFENHFDLDFTLNASRFKREGFVELNKLSGGLLFEDMEKTYRQFHDNIIGWLAGLCDQNETERFG